jgi:hypothetical protein
MDTWPLVAEPARGKFAVSSIKDTDVFGLDNA